MRDALQGLYNLHFGGTTSSVTRTPADAEGGFEWIITFDPGKDPRKAANRGNLPLLSVAYESISAAWSGGGSLYRI